MVNKADDVLHNSIQYLSKQQEEYHMLEWPYDPTDIARVWNTAKQIQTRDLLYQKLNWLKKEKKKKVHMWPLLNML